MKWIVGSFLAIAAAMLCFSFCAGRNNKGRAINCIGSTSIQPLAEMLSQEFDRQHPESIVEVQGGGSTAGLQAVAENIAEIGMCSRSLKDDEAGRFRGIPIALDGLAVVVHPDNPVSNLTKAQIRDIFEGRITNWKQVGGADATIWLITREEGSGTREAFVKLVMEAKDKPAAKAGQPASAPADKAGAAQAPTQHPNHRISRKAMTQESNGAVKELVKHNRGAIGYMSLGLVKDELKILAVDGVYPSLDAVTAKKYPLVRPFLYVVKSTPSQGAQAFIDFTLSAEGQHMLVKEGLISVR
ncbi:MAG: phosphate ABC transporter substrate-binding protein [Phycisphaerae bacterium]|jgi:phosphate transport system substrate-binding protein